MKKQLLIKNLSFLVEDLVIFQCSNSMSTVNNRYLSYKELNFALITKIKLKYLCIYTVVEQNSRDFIVFTVSWTTLVCYESSKNIIHFK